MNRLLHWLHDYPWSFLTAVLFPVWQFGTSTANSLTTLAQASTYGSMGDIVGVIKDLGLPLALIVAAGAAIRELWITLKPKIGMLFVAQARAQLRTVRNSEKLTKLIEMQERKRSSHGQALNRIERQGEKTGQVMEQLLQVAASGVGALKGTDTVSVIQNTNGGE